FAEQRRIRDRARNTPYEAVAELELARCHLKRMQGEQALVIYKALEKKHTWLTCVLYSEIGVAHAMCENGIKAIKFFELAAEHTTPAAMATLKEVSEQLIGKQYWAFWCNVDNLETRQCQNYAWLAGLYSASGQIKKARQHLKQSLVYLNSDALGDAQDVLKQQFAMQMENMFPILAMEPEVRTLSREVRTL
ncbi:MAG: tetratricopeptide (TPR) repeat protein, partial [Candidatus Latescibacterota bacterium]